MVNSGNKVAYHTLGCKLNYAETSAIERRMQGRGFTSVPFPHEADVYVVNTCSVTENANRKCRNAVRRALKQNPDAYVVVIGCYAQLKPREIADIPGVDLVLGAAEKFRLPDLLDDLTKNACGQVRASEIGAADFFVGAYSMGGRTRSFLKIQDGCDYRCSFCTIPLARGKSRSDTLEHIIQQAQEIAAKGVKEIVLTGVNIGDYGKGIEGDLEFLDVVRALDNLDGVERIRISSIEPNLLKNEIIDFVAESRLFMPHFHVPLQSGSNRMLGLMRRRYRRELYTDRVRRIREVMPDACIGVDVIVGFPGETASEFLETYQYLTDLDVAYLHVFTYSERPDTRAVELGQVVPASERDERSRRLRILSEKKRRAFIAAYSGTSRKVLFEQEEKDGFTEGFTDNYIRVRVPGQDGLSGVITPVLLQDIQEEGIMSGRLAASLHTHIS